MPHAYGIHGREGEGVALLYCHRNHCLHTAVAHPLAWSGCMKVVSCASSASARVLHAAGNVQHAHGPQQARPACPHSRLKHATTRPAAEVGAHAAHKRHDRSSRAVNSPIVKPDRHCAHLRITLNGGPTATAASNACEHWQPDDRRIPARTEFHSNGQHVRKGQHVDGGGAHPVTR